MRELIFGTGIAHTILLFALVIGFGLFLGRFKIKGITIGSTWILFVGILFSHFGFVGNPTAVAFMKDFGLILFVFSIGLQVGPGFFHSFREGGVTMNLLATGMVLLSVLVTLSIHWITGESLTTMVGVMSGAVTNTPGLGAAQQAMSDSMLLAGDTVEVASRASDALSSAYAVAYPLGVLGVILVIIVLKAIFHIDPEKERRELEHEIESTADMARRMHCEVENPAVFEKKISEVMNAESNGNFLISRVLHNGEVSIPTNDTVLHKGDRLLIVTSQAHVDSIRIIFGEEVPMHLEDWVKKDEHVVSRRLSVTKSSVNGQRLKDLNIRAKYGVTVTRVVRAGVQLVAQPTLRLQMGDSLMVVGTIEGINHVADLVGNKPEALTHPNLLPIFFGIAIGVIVGSIPITIPGIPQPVKLGLAGGPLIVAIILGHFGPKWKITTYTTMSANMMLREVGICIFLAAVGIGAGETFVSSIVSGGYWWILYGALITIIPVFITGVVARLVFKYNIFQLCGLLTGGTTNAPVLAFAQDAYGDDYTSVNYATVYPLTMFLRVLAAQILVLFALA